jgi:uncharacterized membrane protein
MNYFCKMLSDEEKNFIDYWELNREPHSSFSSKLFRGLPMAMLFGIPIILFIVIIYLFFPEWYTKVSMAITGTVPVIIVAVLIVILGYSFTRMHFKWEMNEQLYNELKHKERNAVQRNDH